MDFMCNGLQYLLLASSSKLSQWVSHAKRQVVGRRLQLAWKTIKRVLSENFRLAMHIDLSNYIYSLIYITVAKHSMTFGKQTKHATSVNFDRASYCILGISVLTSCKSMNKHRCSEMPLQLAYVYLNMSIAYLQMPKQIGTVYCKKACTVHQFLTCKLTKLTGIGKVAKNMTNYENATHSIADQHEQRNWQQRSDNTRPA